jgi:hypothetical protein
MKNRNIANHTATGAAPQGEVSKPSILEGKEVQ